MKKLLAAMLLISTSVFADIVPNQVTTPGDTRQVSMEEVCKPGSANVARDVSESEKSQVFKNYGLKGNHTGYCWSADSEEGCEVDHLISLELGGSNDIHNLWPQPYFGEWNAHMKDKLENKLHKMVCSGKISLKAAQDLISHDWIAGYKTFVEPDLQK